LTVVDTSAIVDYLMDDGVGGEVRELIDHEPQLAAPDVLVFEALSALRRAVVRQTVSVNRATGAIEDLGDLALTLFPSLRLRQRAWELRRNFTAGDALFVALAEELDEPLATKDRALAAEVNKHTGAMVLLLE
jgi:predicted nucleic acid-binding protein